MHYSKASYNYVVNRFSTTTIMMIISNTVEIKVMHPVIASPAIQTYQDNDGHLYG